VNKLEEEVENKIEIIIDKNQIKESSTINEIQQEEKQQPQEQQNVINENNSKNQIEEDKKLIKKIRKEILSNKNSSKSVIFLDENINNEPYKNRLKGIRFGFSTSSSESSESDDSDDDDEDDDDEDVSGNEYSIEQSNKQNIINDDNHHQQQHQQQQIQPLICGYHPSSLHSYITTNYNLLNYQQPVYYINQTDTNKSSTTEFNSTNAQNSFSTSTIVAFQHTQPPLPTTTSVSSNTNNATLAPIMSVLTPIELNQFCITPSSSSSTTSKSDINNSYLIYDHHQQQYHNKPINVISTINNNNRINTSTSK
jgi:hypothetical protein